MDDPDWRSENAADIQSKLEAFYNFALTIIDKAKTDENRHLENWLLSKLQHRIAEVTGSIDELKNRTALEVAFFEVWNDFRWYARRKGNTESKAVREALEIWVRLIAPFAPYVCEEIWSCAGKDGFISLAEWPKVDESKVNLDAEEKENFLTELIEDTLNVLKATKITPKRVCYYTAAPWKNKVYRSMLNKSVEGELKINEVMKETAKDPELKDNMKQVAGFVPKVFKTISKLPNEKRKLLAKTTVGDEKIVIADALEFLKQRFEAEVAVYGEDDNSHYDPKQRASLAIPNQPAIYIE
jgi:leucyl-tRNA synthetase